MDVYSIHECLHPNCDDYTFVLATWGVQTITIPTHSLGWIAMAVSIPATKMMSAMRRTMARFKWMYNNAPLLRDFLCKIRWYIYTMVTYYIQCCLFPTLLLFHLQGTSCMVR